MFGFMLLFAVLISVLQVRTGGMVITRDSIRANQSGIGPGAHDMPLWNIPPIHAGHNNQLPPGEG